METLLLTALAAGALVLATHIPLGRRVLDRGIVFLDLAIAQFAGLGAVFAHAIGLEAGWAVQALAFAVALGGALLLAAADRAEANLQEALIGSAFVVGASLTTLLLAHDPHGGDALATLLVGQILWVSGSDLLWALAATLAVALLWQPLVRHPGRERVGFYAVFALAITVSVQLVGLFLVFASLILPALASHRQRHGLTLAWGAGLAGYGAGIGLSALTDWPTGPTIVVMLALAAAGARVVGTSLRR